MGCWRSSAFGMAFQCFFCLNGWWHLSISFLGGLKPLPLGKIILHGLNPWLSGSDNGRLFFQLLYQYSINSTTSTLRTVMQKFTLVSNVCDIVLLICVLVLSRSCFEICQLLMVYWKARFVSHELLTSLCIWHCFPVLSIVSMDLGGITLQDYFACVPDALNYCIWSFWQW